MLYENEREDLRSQLIYSDPAFVALLYEEVTGESPLTQVSNGATFSGKVGVGFADLSGTTHESKTFNLSTFRMLKIVEQQALNYPAFDPKKYESGKGTEVCWVYGNLTIGEWQDAKKAYPSTMVFEIYLNDEDKLTLVTQRDLFVSGIGLLLQMDSVVSQNINIPVKALCRVLFDNPLIKSHVASPYLILEAHQNSGGARVG